jgi:hypothetical protein
MLGTGLCFAAVQGLANMLWSYAKLPVAPPAVVMALVSKITDQLVQHSQRPDGSPTFDAQVGCRTFSDGWLKGLSYCCVTVHSVCGCMLVCFMCSTLCLLPVPVLQVRMHAPLV